MPKPSSPKTWLTAEHVAAGAAVVLGGTAAWAARVENAFIGNCPGLYTSQDCTVYMSTPALGTAGVLVFVGGLVVLVARETPVNRLRFIAAVTGGAAALWLLTLLKNCLGDGYPGCSASPLAGACALPPPCQPANIGLAVAIIAGCTLVAARQYVRRGRRGVH